MKNKKGGLDPTALAGFFVTLLMLAALWKPITTVVSTLAADAGTTAGMMIEFIPWILVFAIIATLWQYGSGPER